MANPHAIAPVRHPPSPRQTACNNTVRHRKEEEEEGQREEGQREAPPPLHSSILSLRNDRDRDSRVAAFITRRGGGRHTFE